VRKDISWQTRAHQGVGVAGFAIDWEAEQAPCPRGKTSVIWKPTTAADGHDVVNIRFAHAACSICPARPPGVHSSRPRALTVRPREHLETFQAACQRQTTQEVKARSACRAGLEGPLSQGVHLGGLRRSRYVGLAKTRLHHLLLATALNFVRTAAWLADLPLAHTRRSAFAALAQPAA
jgi:transposase